MMQQVQQQQEKEEKEIAQQKKAKGWMCIIVLARNKIASNQYDCSALMKFLLRPISSNPLDWAEANWVIVCLATIK